MAIRRVDDFDMGSALPGRCFIRRTPKAKGESGIFRCGNIDLETGWLDISEGVVEEMADMLGWASEATVTKLKADLAQLRVQLREAERLADQSKIETVIEISTKLDSERRKTRRYAKKIEILKQAAEARMGGSVLINHLQTGLDGHDKGDEDVEDEAAL